MNDRETTFDGDKIPISPGHSKIEITLCYGAVIFQRRSEADRAKRGDAFIVSLAEAREVGETLIGLADLAERNEGGVK